MTLLCAPVKTLREVNHAELVELVELGDEEHRMIYEKGKLRYHLVDWKIPRLPEGEVIVAYHNYDETPDLETVLQELQKAHPQAAFYKIATRARSTLDALRMLEFLQRHRKIIGLCMGELGVITRICAPIFEAPLTYAPEQKEEQSAPGQLRITELREIYHFRLLNPQTKIYGLIGDPTHRSIGHLFHNDVFRKEGRNGVYVKMAVQPQELDAFFAYAKKLPFKGLSVTAPLKEAVLPYVDILDPTAQKIGAVNTLAFREGKIWGFNTDGPASVDVLGAVKGKTLVILGAGGAARALAYSALERKARVILVNRTIEKAQKMARHFGCEWSERVPDYDILVNTTSNTMPIDPSDIAPGKTVMDIAVYETDFLREARRKKCLCLDGFIMFFQQALAQQELWACSTMSRVDAS